jgi:PilZ domain
VSTKGISGDRRSHRRFPIEMELEYKLINATTVVAQGSGRTRNMSSGGILFEGSEEAPSGVCVELTIRWPVVWDSAGFVRLWAFGHVVRSGSDGTAIQISRYQFQKLDEITTAFDRQTRQVLVQ